MSLLYNLNFYEGNGSNTKEHVRGNKLQIEYVFNDATYKQSCSPRWIKSQVSGYALDFDGYSTYIVDEPLEQTRAITISALIAPRCFEACHGNVSTTIIDQLDKRAKKGFALSLFQHGEVQFEVGNGNEICVLRSTTQVPLFRKSLITATYNNETNKASVYINGELEVTDDSVKQLRQANIPLSIGLNNFPFKIGDHFKGGMFAGLIDFIQIYDEALSIEAIKQKYDDMSDKLSLNFTDIDLDETRLLDDIHRPQYHAIPPQHWMNEPHAPFYFNGEYHLLYQKNAVGPYFSNLHWGHWTSDDLVFWKNEKTALFPQKGDITPSGVWSGSAAMGPEGVPYLFYTFADLSKVRNQGVGVALPKNIGDKQLVDWEIYPQQVIKQTEKQGIPSEFRDPFVWKDDQAELWYLIIGGGIEGTGPTAWFYTSDNCIDWEFKGEFFTVDKNRLPHLGDNWELPVLLPVSDSKGNKKFVFIFMSHFVGTSDYQVDTYYYLGEFDKDNGEFIPETEDAILLDYGQFKFSGPSGFVDPVTKKTIVFSILQGDRSEREEYESGWAHNAGLPVELFLENNDLRMKPLENLTALREELLVDETNQSLGDVNEKLQAVNGKMLEIIVEFENTQEVVGLDVKKDPENQEKTSLIFDKQHNRVWIDRTKSSMNREGDIKGGLLEIDQGLSIHIYIDHSTIESYFNNKKMISSRSYPSLANSDYLSLIGNDTTTIKSIKVFKLKSIWEKGSE